MPRYLYAVAAFRLGHIELAHESAAALLHLLPGFTVSGLVAGNITASDQIELLAEALLGVGLPR